MNSSLMDRRITIKKQDETLLARGVRSQEWNDYKANIAAAMATSGSYEVMKARERFSQLDTVWTIRWFKSVEDETCGVNAQMQVFYKGQKYEILAVEPVGQPRHDAIKIYCRKFGDGVTG